MANDNNDNGLLGTLSQLFRGYNKQDADNANIDYDIGNTVITDGDGGPFNNAKQLGDSVRLNQGGGFMPDYSLPEDRQSRYSIYSRMSKSELVSACLQMHVAYALSPDMKSGNIITIQSKVPEFNDLAKEVMDDLGDLINSNVTAWAMLMCVFGVHYIRPMGVEGKGVTDIESNYYTLAKNIREYVRGDLTCGFTSDYLKIKDGKQIRLADPWVLVPCKIPYWHPFLEMEPFNNTGVTYSLYDDYHRRTPMETQNYGTSLLEFAYPAWCELMESVTALRGARYNASRLDRFIGVGMDGLDPAAAASYLNTIGTQLKADIEAEAKVAARKGMRPTVWNRIFPVLAGSKGGLTVDAQQTSADINGIEDVMFNLKRFCSAMGIDPSMIGWGDLMAGGLGEGGWTRTSIIAALRANWIRIGIRDAVMRLIDIHLAFKHKKAFPRSENPFEVNFHSINSAIATEIAAERQSHADFFTTVVTLLDMMNTNGLAKSQTLYKKIMGEVGLDDDEIETIVKELEKAGTTDQMPPPAGGSGGGMYESVNGLSLDERVQNLVTAQIVKLFSGDTHE